VSPSPTDKRIAWAGCKGGRGFVGSKQKEMQEIYEEWQKLVLFFPSLQSWLALSRSFYSIQSRPFLLSGREMIKTIPGKRCIVPCDLTGLENMGVLLFLSF
jgi:hypothetical protein